MHIKIRDISYRLLVVEADLEPMILGCWLEGSLKGVIKHA